MKKILIIICISLISLKSFAGDGDFRLNYYGGLQSNSIRFDSYVLNHMVSLEIERLNRKCWDIYFDYSVPMKKYEDGKLHPKYDYRSLGLGVAYKPVVLRNLFLGYKNSLMRFRLGCDMGGYGTVDGDEFYTSIDFGFEYTKTFRNGMELILMEKNDAVFWGRDSFRAGLYVGFKIPLN